MSAAARRRYFLGMAAAGIVWALLLAGLLLAPRISDGLEARERAAVEQDAAEFAEVRGVRDRVRLIRSYMGQPGTEGYSRSCLECLRVIIGILPPDLQLSSITYTREVGVEVKGEIIGREGAANDFKKEIDNCKDLFAYSYLKDLSRADSNKRKGFTVQAYFDPPKEGGRK